MSVYTDTIFQDINRIPQYEYHINKSHILVNPNQYNISAYASRYDTLSPMDPKIIRKDHKIHIFLSWMTTDDVTPLTNFMNICNKECIHKIIIHVPRSADDVTLSYIMSVLQNFPSTVYKIYRERDGVPVKFKWGRSGDVTLEICSIFGHKYKATLVYKK